LVELASYRRAATTVVARAFVVAFASLPFAACQYIVPPEFFRGVEIAPLVTAAPMRDASRHTALFSAAIYNV